MSTETLTCNPMNYGWGKVGRGSLVYQLLEGNGRTELSLSKNYAELWMGDHPSAPSLLENGKRISEHYGEIPFLSKILSINSPLSLQCHPTKSQAEKLRQAQPSFYPDSNEKPEMALFLTKTKLLFGFRAYSEIKHYLETVSEFQELCGDSGNDFINLQNHQTLKALFTTILRTPHDKVLEIVTRLQAHINSTPSLLDDLALEAFKCISTYYPQDIGNFFPLFLNTIEGEPGRAIYIPPGSLHSYLSGDLYEIMTVSDNVIRAALTPKHIDIDNLLEIVDFQSQTPFWVEPTQESPEISLYNSPHNLFTIKMIKTAKASTVSIPGYRLPSIFIALEGECQILEKTVKKGQIELIPREIPYEVSTKGDFVGVVGSMI